MYVTPCYSIENFYVSVSAVRRILTNEYGVESLSDDSEESELEYLIKVYDRLINEFCDSTTILNAFIFLHVKNENSRSRLNLRGQDITSMVRISLGGIEQKYEVETFSQLFPDASDIDDAELLKQISKFILLENKPCCYRGKYLIEFLRIFLTLLRDDRNSENPQFFKTKGRVGLNLSKNNILSELSQYAETPQCLLDFLKN
ncbi:DUF4435 domain-containing protein [Acidithiobacillus ferrivorans]|uniref:DUF4435 domain-containing protein n=1 Tax=Acidithiobacillus ferrivorans TaxID=160808 RepID=UPI001E3A1DF3|nr:DUF4435 domain-containing protein [Acidithiobacillus ferrivorans]